MFDDIGGKIKKYAKITTWIGIILFAILGLIMVIMSVTGGETIEALVGIIYAVLGGLFSWLGNFFVYAFGELAEQSELQTGLLYQMLECKVVQVHNTPNGTSDVVPTWKRIQMEQEAKQDQ